MDNATWFTVVALYAVLEIVARGALARTLWHVVALVFVEVELFAINIVRYLHPPRFVLTGGCHKRGVCCTQIVGDPPQFIKRTFLMRAWLAMHRVLHNFHPAGEGPDGQVIFRCSHLLASGKCGIYRFRPFICRNYPVVPYYNMPPILPGCGYVAIPRVVATMRPRTGLAILRPHVAVHHPSPVERDVDLPEHYELVAEEPLHEETRR